MLAYYTIVVSLIVLARSSLANGNGDPSDTQGASYSPTNTVTINTCCIDEDIKEELRYMKDLLTTMTASLRNGGLLGVQGHQSQPYPRDCYELLQNGESSSGVYIIQPAGSEPFSVYCDQDTSGGGWTVFQRREDGSRNFYRDWTAYKNGFGDPGFEFWLGNDKLFYLSDQQTYLLRVDLTDFDNEKRYAVYDRFVIADENSKYKLEISGYSGNAGDAMAKSNGMKFSTKDQDNDPWHNSCAQTYKGGWWYAACHDANLNGLYFEGEHKTYADGINWNQWHGYYYSLKFTEMKLKPASVG